MPYYLTRIELHSAQYDDYTNLHAAMQKEGFARTIKADNGITYQLPTAEYCKIGSFQLNAVLESGKRADNTIGKKYEIIVGQCDNLAWEGLPSIG